LKLEETVEILQRTPAVVRSLLEGLSEEWLGTREAPATFSPRDVLAHLIHGEETDWMPRVRITLAHGRSRAYEPFDRVGGSTIAGRPLPELLSLFDALRSRNLAELAGLGLGPEQMRLPGLHPELGPVTLGQLLSTWAVHDLNHVGQIARVMARRYADEVGPWTPYLGILQKK
jgi:hypothetical protein